MLPSCLLKIGRDKSLLTTRHCDLRTAQNDRASQRQNQGTKKVVTVTVAKTLPFLVCLLCGAFEPARDSSRSLIEQSCRFECFVNPRRIPHHEPPMVRRLRVLIRVLVGWTLLKLRLDWVVVCPCRTKIPPDHIRYLRLCTTNTASSERPDQFFGCLLYPLHLLSNMVFTRATIIVVCNSSSKKRDLDLVKDLGNPGRVCTFGRIMVFNNLSNSARPISARGGI